MILDNSGAVYCKPDAHEVAEPRDDKIVCLPACCYSLCPSHQQEVLCMPTASKGHFFLSKQAHADPALLFLKLLSLRQVERLDDPSLVGKPLAVQQFNAGGFVAVSYEVTPCPGVSAAIHVKPIDQLLAQCRPLHPCQPSGSQHHDRLFDPAPHHWPPCPGPS